MGKMLFSGAVLFRKLGFLRRAMLEMIRSEQTHQPARRPMSSVVWDMFTGSAPYSDILMRSLKPQFFVPFLIHCAKAPFATHRHSPEAIGEAR
jgi:hypothetical protein